MDDVPSPWQDALLAARVLAAAGPSLGGIRVRARAGPARDAWLDYLQSLLAASTPWKRITPSFPEGALIGGLDIAATLEKGVPVVETGLLARADRGIVVIAMAERTAPSMAALVGAALDSGTVRIERHGISAIDSARITLIALDEGIDTDERLPTALSDRLALSVDLSTVGWREAGDMDLRDDGVPLADAIAAVTIPDKIEQALAGIALQAGEVSLRRAIFLTRVARTIAAIDGCGAVEPVHAGAAVRLVLPALSAVEQPEEEEERTDAPPPPESEPQSSGDEDQTLDLDTLQDLMVAAKAAALPAELDISRAMPRRAGAQRAHVGKSGASRRNARRGRPVGVTAKPPYPGARITVLATLRTAALWQQIRRRERTVSGRKTPGRLDIRKSDFRYTRFKHETESTAILTVDASGSTALDRLGEAKGAAELLLADCYVRRDNVALIAFRGRAADLLLPPTRSLVRAKRSLAAVPGGGGTPLASGLVGALELANAVRHHGQSPLVVLMTDGSANIALDGAPGREAAARDAETIAAHFATVGVPAIVIDIGRRPSERTAALARLMAADYHALPRADAHSVSAVVSGYMRS